MQRRRDAERAHKLVLKCRRVADSKIFFVASWYSQPDLVSETSCNLSNCPFKPTAQRWTVQSSPPKIALYVLTERARVPISR